MPWRGEKGKKKGRGGEAEYFKNPARAETRGKGLAGAFAPHTREGVEKKIEKEKLCFQKNATPGQKVRERCGRRYDLLTCSERGRGKKEGGKEDVTYLPNMEKGTTGRKTGPRTNRDWGRFLSYGASGKRWRLRKKIHEKHAGVLAHRKP